MMERAEIEALLPHRSPMLFVDRVVEVEPGAHALAEHDVQSDAFWVQGHFPGDPVMPGVLVAEALAQTAALVYLAQNTDDAQRSIYLVGYDNLRLRRPVRPGDTLVLKATLTDGNRRMWTFDAEASVNGRRVATGTLRATLA